MQVIIIGYGLAGRVFHAPLLQLADFEIAAIIVRDVERREQAVKNHPSALLYNDLSTALAECPAELVVLASPPDSHASLAIAALQAGRHVVIDKPFTIDVGEADAVISAAQTANKLVIPFQNRRWDADFLSLQALLQANTLGSVVRYEARFDRYNPKVKDRWREHDIPGAGMLYDLGSHLIDQALCLFGAPEWVSCTQMRQRNGAQTDDAFELTLGSHQAHYPYIQLGASMFSAAGDTPLGAPRFKVNGHNATWLKSGFDPQENALKNIIDARLTSQLRPSSWQNIVETDAARGYLIDGKTGSVSRTAAGVGQWPIFYAQVKKAIKGLSIAPVLATQARLTCMVIDAARRSSQIGQRVYLD